MLKTLLIINSEQRDTGTGSNFNYSLDYYALTNVQSFRINKIICPYSWYNIRTQEFTVSQGGPPITIIFPGGSYTANSLITTLQNLINPVLVGAILTITYSNITNKFTFDISVGSLTFNFLFDNIGKTFNYNLAYQIGFSQYSEQLNPPTFFNTYTALYSADLSATYNLYISCPNLNFYIASIYNRIKSNVIQSVPVIVNSYNFIVWENQLETVFELDNTTINTLSFQLLDDFNNVIDLEGLNIILEIELSLSQVN